MEKNYDFKTDLLTVHKRGVRNPSLSPRPDEYEIRNGLTLLLPEYDEDDVILTAARDFLDYLFVSQGVSAMLSKGEATGDALCISLTTELGEAAGYMGYRITVTDAGITLEGYDVRGVAQGLYALEDRMNLRRAPFLTKGTVARRAVFKSRRTNSPFGMLEYNDAALSLIAHYGMDTIDLWIDDPYTTQRKDYIDLRLLSERAARYGLDVSVLIRSSHDKNPTDEGAEEYYDAMYGELMRACPRIKYIKLLGETTHFKSRDPNVTPSTVADGIPTGKLSPGWWPCCDYPEWIAMIKRAIEKHSKDAKIIFSTYNWGFVDEKERLKLIKNLPDGIILEATWDMYQHSRSLNTVKTVPDYSLSSVGPGDYFRSEAIALAKRGGIELSANAQTSGRTWDFGVVSYEPMPGQWIRRYRALLDAHRDWGLAHIFENIHYGFYPSFIMDLEKEAFFTGGAPLDTVLKDILARDFEENAEEVGKACRLLDEAITHYVPTNEDMYSAYRIGPAYPLILDPQTGKRGDRAHAMFGNALYNAVYSPDDFGECSLSGVRIFDEMREGEQMRDLLLRAIAVLEACPDPNRKLLKLLNLVRFIYRCVLTALANKTLHILRSRLAVAGTRENAAALLSELEALLLAERQNVEATIPLVQYDSRLGWEPSMEYVCDEEALRWKLSQLDHELTRYIPKLRSANDMIDKF